MSLAYAGRNEHAYDMANEPRERKKRADDARDEDVVPESEAVEPKIATTQEDAARAAERLDWQERHDQARWPHTNDPFRPPGGVVTGAREAQTP
jgi:hypothetical protein